MFVQGINSEPIKSTVASPAETTPIKELSAETTPIKELSAETTSIKELSAGTTPIKESTSHQIKIETINTIHLPLQPGTGPDTSTEVTEIKMCRDVSLKNKPHFKLVQSENEKAKAAFMTDKLWTTGRTITVGFIGGEAWKWAWIAKIVTQTIMVYANLNFQFNFNPAQSSTCNIRISFDESSGCYSYLGTDALDSSLIGYETMNFGWMDAPYSTTFTYNGVSYTTPFMFDRGGYPGTGTTIVHEFGHALGMIHEHQTPFNNPLTWDTAKVYQMFSGPPNNWPTYVIDDNIIQRYSSVNMNGSDFDSASIMKYSFSSTMLLNPSPTLASYIQQFNTVLSSCDKYWLAQNYPGRNVTTSCSLGKNNPPLNVPVNCTVSAWGEWSTCSASCGGGTQTQTRTVITPAENGGTACPALTQSRSCNTQACTPGGTPVDCVVSAWSEWSQCDAACNGTQMRTRTIVTPSSNGGATCPALTETQPCNTQCEPKPRSKTGFYITLVLIFVAILILWWLVRPMPLLDKK